MKKETAWIRFRAIRPVLSLSLHLLLVSIPILAQTNTGGIYGTVLDPSGSVIANANVVLTHVATGSTRIVTANSSGYYDVPALPIGGYTLAVSSQGFQQSELKDIVLHIGESLRYDVTLQVGEMRQTITVSAAPALIQLTSAEVSDLIEEQRVIDLPLNRREYISLALLSGAATGFSGTSTISGRQVNAPLIMVAGQRENRNLYRLNGVPVLSVSLGTLPLTPSIDSIQEFKIITTGASAEHGFQTGGQIIIATKAGTNSLHGVFYEFLRNDVLDARNFLDIDTPKFRRNQFGASLGGALIPDKLFWFANYEGLREIKGRPFGTTVPTDAMVDGDFSALLPTTQLLDPFNGFNPYSGNIIPPSQFNPVSLQLLQKMPSPNRPGSTNFTAAPAFRELANQANARMDYHLNSSDTFWGSATWTNDNPSEPFPAFQLLGALTPPPGFGTNTTLNALSVSIHEIHVFSPTLVNESRVGYTRTFFSQVEEDQGTDFGIQGTTTDPNQIGSPEVNIAGFAGLGSSAVSDVFTDNLFDFADSVTWTKGKHTLKFGGEFVRHRSVLFELFPNRGAFLFAPAFTGDAFADFLVGLPFVALVGVGESNGYNFQWWGALYAHDVWRATPTLTLNLGLRYNYFSPWKEARGQRSGFDTSFPGGRLVLGCASLSSCPDIIPGLLSGVPFALAKDIGWPSSIRDAPKTDFAPRVGFAWSPTKNLVVRGGYSIFYSPRYVLQSQGAMEAPPFQQIKSGVNTGLDLFENFLANLPLGAPSNVVIIGGREGDTAMSQQRSLGIQYSVRPDLMLEAQYVGSNAVHLPASPDFNQPAPGGPRPFPAFGNMTGIGTPVARSNYNALIVRAVKRPTHGLLFAAAWTWSHSIDIGSLDQIQSGVAFVPQNSNDMSGERGRSNFDHRHRFVFSTLYELPIGEGTARLSSGVAGSVFGHWKVGGIMTLRSGQAVTINLAADNSLTGNFNADRPNWVCDPNSSAPRTAEEWFNTACFVAPPPLTFGNVGRNTVTGPELANFDFSLLKDIPFGREGTKLEFRAEFFNIFNHPNFLEFNRLFGGSGFGEITRVADAREIQFGLKLSF